MLFNSYIFIFVFLPIVFFGYFRIGKYNHSFALLWLSVASLFFYGWWDLRYVGLLLGSITFNFFAGYLIGYWISDSNKPVIQSKIILSAAILVNLILLGYFKYTNFFVSNLNNLLDESLQIDEIILPLGISFFTFTQIAFLVDTYQGKVKEFNFAYYTLFVTYFPHLIAGPVLHHKEMMPQFAKLNICVINWDNVNVGLSIFVLGLAKKVLIADSLANYSTPIFDTIASGGQPMLFEAWIGALSYTFQLYFYFSAYSDMAIGLSLIFNVRLPINFNSPYKATSIIDFWRRWHMTLSRFLREYLYIPLGGSRNGKVHRYLNLMITMILGGLWHGAGWTFVVWGCLHGFYLMVNHAWRSLKSIMGWGDGGQIAKVGAGALTFFSVVVAWVFFRADSYSSALTMLKGMLGMNGQAIHSTLDCEFTHSFSIQSCILLSKLVPISDINSLNAIIVLVGCFVIVWFMPNIQQLFKLFKPACTEIVDENLILLTVEYTLWIKIMLAFILGTITTLALIFISADSPFLYFQF